jgi:hypothetical protein
VGSCPCSAAADDIHFSCEIKRLITANDATSSTRRLVVKIRFNEELGELRFDDESVWGAAQIERLTDNQIDGVAGPLYFQLHRKSGRLVRTMGGGGRSLIDTGQCAIEKTRSPGQ